MRQSTKNQICHALKRSFERRALKHKKQRSALRAKNKKSAQQETNCRALKHKELRLRSAEAVFLMPRAETHFETLRLSGNASFELRPSGSASFKSETRRFELPCAETQKQYGNVAF